MDEENQRKVAEFCSITGADTERAEFFLQAAGWDTGLAVSTFFENEGEATESSAPPQAPFQVEDTPVASNPTPPKPVQSAGQGASRIQTFANWISGRPSEETSDDDDQGQAYYAGGSDTSGQQILGPPKKDGKKKNNIAEELFKAAREHGAEEVTGSDRTTKPQQSHFVGTGYRLGESVGENLQAVAGATKQKQPVTVVLKMWQKGFTLNDGPLRLFNDPENRQFLDSIHRGEIPQELITMADGGKVAVDMEDHSSEEYVPPKQPKMRAFTGAGQTLGAESTPQASTSAIAACASADPISVDTSLPVTNIQIWLEDGSRLVARFNHSHTVGDIRSHIVSSRSEYAGVAFSLLTTLPNRRLTDDSLTLKAADLLNATVMQKL